MDRGAHRHRGAPYRRRRRNHRHARHRSGAQGARLGGRGAGQGRAHRARHRHAGPDLSGQRHEGADGARHRRLHRLRRRRSVHRIPLRPLGRRQYAERRDGGLCARHRLRDVQPHPRLGRSRHLRPVRRRRGRDPAQGRGDRRPGHPRDEAPCRRAAQRPPLCRWRRFDDGDGRQAAHEGQGSLPPCGGEPCRRPQRGAGRRRPQRRRGRLGRPPPGQ